MKVKEYDDKDEHQALNTGAQWYTTDGKVYKPSGNKNSYCLITIDDLKTQLEQNDEVRINMLLK